MSNDVKSNNNKPKPTPQKPPPPPPERDPRPYIPAPEKKSPDDSNIEKK